jgi:AcrR family transcriptional regulator
MSAQIDTLSKDFNETQRRILNVAAEFFSEDGYSQVSIRQIVSGCGITPAALYYYFPDKSSLYRETLAHVFAEKISPVTDIVGQTGSTGSKLRNVLRWYTNLMSTDRIFSRLLHREMLAGDESRIAFITSLVFQRPFLQIAELVSLLAPKADAERLTISIFSIILGHFQMESIQQYMLDDTTQLPSPDAIAEHALSFVLLTAREAE